MNKEIMTEEKAQRFRDIHNDIVLCGHSAARFAYQMASDLKTMRDEKLYLGGGYATFEEYTVSALNMKVRNAYNYIQIVETYPQAFLQSNADLGITKLLLLAPLSEEQRSRILNEADDDSVRELKARIETLQKEKGEQQSLFEKEKEDAVRVAISAGEKKFSEEIKKLQEKNRKISFDLDKKEKELKELKTAPAQVKFVDNEADKRRIAQLEKQVADAKAEKEAVEKRLEIAKDANVTRFSVLFEQLQNVLSDVKACLDSITDATVKLKCEKGLKSILGGYYND